MKKSIIGSIAFGIPALLLTIAMLGACSTVKVTADYDGSFDFSLIQTFGFYKWAPESGKIINELDKERVESAVGHELTLRGLKYARSGSDVIIALHVMSEGKTDYRAANSGMGYGGYSGHGPGWSWGPRPDLGMDTIATVGDSIAGTPQVKTIEYSEGNYKVGTLVVDIYDAKNQNLIFEGIGNGTLDDNPETREKNLPKNIARIMALYPLPRITDHMKGHEYNKYKRHD